MTTVLVLALLMQSASAAVPPAPGLIFEFEVRAELGTPVEAGQAQTRLLPDRTHL